jgi:hypothetical protein
MVYWTHCSQFTEHTAQFTEHTVHCSQFTERTVYGLLSTPLTVYWTHCSQFTEHTFHSSVLCLCNCNCSWSGWLLRILILFYFVVSIYKFVLFVYQVLYMYITVSMCTCLDAIPVKCDFIWCRQGAVPVYYCVVLLCTHTSWIHKCVIKTAGCATSHKYTNLHIYSLKHYKHFTKQNCRSYLHIKNSSAQ